MSYFINGFLIELALIMAVGLQNAFVLKQGMRSEYVIAAVLVCSVSESVLVAIGITGMGAILTSRPALITAITILGVVFLISYSVKSLYTAIKSQEHLDIGSVAGKGRTLRAVISSALAFSLLNPHVLLDTTLMGALSTRYYPNQWLFGAGVISAAFLWFCFLGTLGKLLAKPLNNPKTWRFINIFVAILCAYMAYTFASDLYHGHDEEHREHSTVLESIIAPLY